MERIENKEIYRKKESLRGKIKKILARHIMWIPVIMLVIGLFLFFRIYTIQQEKGSMPRANYDELVDYKDYQKKPESRDKLQQIKNKLTAEQDKDRKSRYERIIGGKELVTVDFEGKAKMIEEKNDIDSVKVNEKEKVNSKPAKKGISRSVTYKNRKASAKKMLQQLNNGSGDLPGNKGKTANGKFVKADSALDSADVMILHDHFNMTTLYPHHNSEFIKAYVQGDQELINGSYLKLRLGEDLKVDGQVIAKNRVFHGKVSLNANVVHIHVDRIHQKDVDYKVYDRDYSEGILLHPDKELKQTADNTIYRSGFRTAADLPLEIAQDLARSLLQEKRRKARVIRINDGYPVYISKTSR